MSRILIVEDDTLVADFVSRGLHAHDHTTMVTDEAGRAAALALSGDFDLVILDIGLPGGDGFAVLEQVRGRGGRVPIIVLTGRPDLRDAVEALDHGADDYMTKPFRFDELLARVRVRLRRTGTEEPATLSAADVTLDLRTRRAVAGGAEVELTAREFALLEIFLRHPGQVLSREQLLSHVWGYYFEPGTNVVNVHVASLRRKLGHDVIETVRGTGYRLRSLRLLHHRLIPDKRPRRSLPGISTMAGGGGPPAAKGVPMSAVLVRRAALAVALAVLVAAPAAAAAPPPKDTTPPETTIDSGPASPTASTSATFTFSSNEANSTFECSLDGARFARCTSPRSYSGLALGQHSFQVRAQDKARNADPTPATWTWTVGSPPPDTTPPETTIDSGPPSNTTTTSATFAFSSNEAGSTFQCALDGAAFAACTSPRSYSGLATGQHTFQVRARDAAGNTDPTPATYTWTIQSQGVQVSCGEVLTRSTTVGNDLVDCLGDGLVVGSDNITVDLNGHTIDGVGLGAGVRNDGFSFVIVRNGTIQEFDQGVLLGPGTQINVVEDLTAQANQVAGVELAGAGSDNRVRDNTLLANAVGISLIDGSTGNTVSGNTVPGGGNSGIVLVAASGNTLLANTVSGTGEGAIDLSLASNANRVEGNVVTASGDAGISVSDSDGNQLLSNTTSENSDAGISLSAANDGVVSGNDVRFNPTGIELQASNGNRIEANNASNANGGGIELEGESLGNDLLSNIANANGGSGIFIASEALGVPGNLLDGNTASGNGEDGIHVAEGGHTIRGNTANSNLGWGIFAEVGNTDGGGNTASGNGQPEQCFGVRCGR